MIGSALVEALVKRGAKVTVADSLWRGKKENLIQHGHLLIDFEHDFHHVERGFLVSLLKRQLNSPMQVISRSLIWRHAGRFNNRL